MVSYRVPVLEEFSWQPPVKDKDLADAPGAPSKNDRYIVASGTTTGDDWFGHTDDIAYYDGSNWQFDTPSEGWMIWVEDENSFYHYTDSAWDAGDISGMEAAILANASNISDNSDAISVNIGNISDNASDISGNSAAISANKGVYVPEYGAIEFAL